MKKLLIILSVLVIGFSSCKKDLDVVKPETPASMSDLKVSSDFDWKTTRQVNLELKGFINGMVEVLSPKGTVYQRVRLFGQQTCQIKLTVPAYETNVRLQYMGQSVDLKLDSGTLHYEFKKP
jgi:hypothetical protein